MLPLARVGMSSLTESVAAMSIIHRLSLTAWAAVSLLVGIVQAQSQNSPPNDFYASSQLLRFNVTSAYIPHSGLLMAEVRAGWC